MVRSFNNNLQSGAATLYQKIVSCLGATFLSLAFSGILSDAAIAQTAERRIVTIEDADYFGSDYRTVKDVDLDLCKAACIDDNQCRAFTFNVSAGWCFLKSDFGDLQVFEGAVAGRVVEIRTKVAVSTADRKAELDFIAKRDIDAAEKFARVLPSTVSVGRTTANLHRRNGQEALAERKGGLAEQDFSRLLALLPQDFNAWQGLTFALLIQDPDDWQRQQALKREVKSAALNAYLRAGSEVERGIALELIASAYEKNTDWKPVIKALRAALVLNERPALRQRYEKVVAQHGFRIVDHQVDAEAATPRICVILSSALSKSQDPDPFVSVIGPGNVSVETAGNQICIDGVTHGERYTVQVRSGLLAADGEKLERSSDLKFYVRDRSPAARFLGRAYVLPKGKDATIPIVSVNTREIDAVIYRIGDRGLAETVRSERFLKQLGSYQAEQITEMRGEEVWSGTIETETRLNVDVTTAIPLEDIGLEMEAGVYAMTARSRTDTENRWGPLATQWFIVSDLGLSTLSGADGVTANVRSLATARALPGVSVRLVAINNEILGEATTDENGFANFSRGLTRGRGGMAPSLLVAETKDGDYSFLDLRKPAFDLSDRGVEGRPDAGPLDVFVWTDRGIYKAGDTVHAQALMRDGKANAVPGLPLTFIFDRPDGVEHKRMVVQDKGAGGHLYDLDLAPSAQQGVWTWRVHVDPKGSSLAQGTFLVEDYQPERVDYEIETDVEMFDAAKASPVRLTAKFLYGAPASGQTLEGDIVVSPTRSLDAWPEYVFGLEDRETYPIRDSLPSGLKTDQNGHLEFDLALPGLPQTTALYSAQVIGRLVETGGRYVERRLSLPVAAKSNRIGIKPSFDGGIDEGGTADFQVVVVGPRGNALNADGLTWEVVRIERRYQWYRTDGSWNYEPITISKRVANGSVASSGSNPAKISVPVDWGQYRIEISLDGDTPIASSLNFSAGWYAAGASSETPDNLDVALNKTAYQPGDTALLRLDPQFAGTAVVNVVSNRLLYSTSLEVKAEETSLELPVTDDWGAGAYVTASLFRPMDLAENRMPSRAVGLNWLQVDAGERKLVVDLETPERIRPRSTLSVPVNIGNLAEGEQAFLTLAAVDVGILNLTRFETPDPDGWYFGQRRLGMEIRDLYGQLIDRTAGVRGRVRSGGDFDAMGLQAPPPDEEPVALFSGLVTLDDQGWAQIEFDVPDFNGTLRLMAVAWTNRSVGHADKEVEVRDQVVLTASLPKFLAPGDRSRLLLEVDNVDGPAGSYELTVSTEGPVALLQDVALRSLDLAPGERRQVLLPITADARTGDASFYVALDGPEGASTVKDLALGIRDSQPEVYRRSAFNISRGGALVLDGGISNGLRQDTVKVTVATGGAARIDVPGLLGALDRYPYGCTEQTASRALPLLYLNEVAQAAGLGTEDDLRERVVKAITRILANQSSSGSFGLWNSFGDSDTWLDAYVADFLTRAVETGYYVPDTAYELALDNLENRLSYASDFSDGGEGIAYALYILARTGRASIGDLRYYLDTKLADFGTPLAKAQVAAGLALYGETLRARRGFDAAVAALPGDRLSSFRTDYGSPVRDGAGILSYIASTGVSRTSEANVASFLADRQGFAGNLSTQDMAWLLLAAKEMNQTGEENQLEVNGVSERGRLLWTFDGDALSENTVRLANLGDTETSVMVSVTGKPVFPEPAGGEGFEITRQYFDLEGEAIDPSAVPYNTRMAVVVKVRPSSEVLGRLLIVDRLPAGVAIDNPRLVRSGDLGALDWLTTIDRPAHVEFRADRFVVSVDQNRFNGSELTFAYLARAVTPGSFAHPPATVEDMYRPDRRAVSESARFEILGPVR